MKISKKKHLEIAIESIPNHPKPKIELEQYFTPPMITADIIWNAYNLGDIYGKNIIDLGCGTGIFTISSLIMGAKIGVGIDIDHDSINIAKETANSMEISDFYFLTKDIYEIKDFQEDILLNCDLTIGDDFNFDTSFTNPPFGSQSRSKRGADRIFMELSSNLANISYSFHMVKTKEFVKEYYESLGGTITHEFFYNFPIPHTYDFHEDELKNIEVIVLRVKNDF